MSLHLSLLKPLAPLKKRIIEFSVLLKQLVSFSASKVRKTRPKYLEFGCGPKCRDGYKGVDIRWFPGVYYICDSWHITKYVAQNSVYSIYSRHFVEHLTFRQVDLTLNAWMHILVPGGSIDIILPDLEYHVRQYLEPGYSSPSECNPNWTIRQHALAGFWGWQREGETKFWDVHKCGFDFPMLKERLEQHGFSNVERIDDKSWNLHIKAFKR